MNLSNYEQFALPEEFLGFQAKFLVAEAEVIIGFWDEKPVALELPPKMTFTVVDTMDAIAKGNSSGSITKDAKLDTGLTIQVPPFIKMGDKVRVSTEDGSYVERA
jgi:elongation factor P